MTQLTPFQKSALDYKRHISLTANAGSGKTFVLAKRYVEIALRENIPLSKIVAITFTEKAAGELNKKIAAEIDLQIKNTDDESDRKILHRMRRQLTSANISTIHSFCINLLREFSPEAGIDANFTPLNKADTDELLNLAVEDFVRKNLVHSGLTPDLKDVIRLLGGKNNFSSEISSIIADRKNLEKLGQSLYSKNDSEIKEFYQLFIEEYLHSLFNNELSELLKNITELNNVVLTIDTGNTLALEIKNHLNILASKKNGAEKFEELRSIAGQMLTKSLTVKKTGYIKKEYDNNLDLIEPVEKDFSELKNLLKLDFSSDYTEPLLFYSRKIFTIANEILKLFNERKRKSGYLDFEDILIETKYLTTNDEFIEQLYDKYDYIMIDEYQDTNEIQYEIFMPILKNLQKGNLFVVGDDKQSIYMFRDAELEVFEKTKSEITSYNDKGNLLLPHSFRVAPVIAQFVNEVCGTLLQNPNPIYNEVGYDELICARPEESSGNVEFLLSDAELMSEADFTANKILECVSSDPESSYGDFAILCRKRNDFFELEKSLSDRNIQYVIAGGKGFFQRQTVYDVYNYVSFLLNSNDDAALVGILRSPFYLLPDDLIYMIYLEKGESYFDKLKNYSKKKPQLAEIVSSLNEHINLASSVRISALLREVFRSTQYWGVTAGRKNFEQELSNLYKLIGVARKFTEQSFKTLYDFKVYLDEAISLFEDEGQAQLSGLSNAVKIMTLHQSKGLEFKSVILYKCNDRTRESVIKAKSISLDKNLGVLTKVPKEKDYFAEYISPPVVDIHNHIQNKKQLAENKRLLYVGMTRAIDNLFISASINNEKISQNSFLELIEFGLNKKIGKEDLSLKSKLKFMRGAEEDFEIYERELETKLKVTSEINVGENVESQSEVERLTEFNLAKLSDHEKNEIVSATKIAIFTQCPTKYYLTYELGFIELLKITKSYSDNYEFKQGEDEDVNVYADIKGQIIHKILELEINREELNEKLNDIIPKYISNLEEVNIDEIKQKISADLNRFYESSIYRELQSADKYYNEYEIYSKETDYYLYGIIDKLIVEGSNVVIVDYKTDNVGRITPAEKAEHYLPQLQFYAYAVRKMFKSVQRITVKLIFIQSPDNSVEFKFSVDEIDEFGKYISESVKKIRAQQFDKNLAHCSSCHFYIDNRCVFQEN